MNRPKPPPDRLILLGTVAGAHGVKGVLKLRPAGGPPGDPDLFPALGEVELDGRRRAVRWAGRTARHLLLALDGVATREEAQALTGQEVRGEARRFPPLPPGEYYWFQLLGLTVRHARSGEELGALAEIIPTPAHDVYVVRQGDREVLLPAVEEVITAVNLEEGWLTALPPPGLLEVYAD